MGTGPSKNGHTAKLQMDKYDAILDAEVTNCAYSRVVRGAHRFWREGQPFETKPIAAISRKPRLLVWCGYLFILSRAFGRANQA
jgi:hypothetical protein